MLLGEKITSTLAKPIETPKRGHSSYSANFRYRV
jgi:hypothetical protein